MVSENVEARIRRDIVDMVYNASSGHIGGALSLVEIMTTLYFDIMNIDPKNPNMPERDFLILSKGHASAVLYSTLARRGYFDPELLKTFRQLESKLQGHPDKKKLVGVEASTGSLGQGVSIAVGVALAHKMDNKPNKVYTIVGDGEMQEGLFWEASMAANHYNLVNFTLIIDNNGLQIDGANDTVMSLGDIEAKMKAFGYSVYVIDGHNKKEILKTLKIEENERPKCIIAKTIKGKGVSFMENDYNWHGKAPSKEEYEKAIKEL